MYVERNINNIDIFWRGKEIDIIRGDLTFIEILALEKHILNITLYGANNETYNRLYGNPNGFTQVMRAVELLKERNIQIKFNMSLTPYNIDVDI